mgnify:FL=1
MKTLLYKYLCGKCNTSFKSPGISGEIYGEFLLRSEKASEVAYLNAFKDSFFEEVGKIFDEVVKHKSIGNFVCSDIFQSIFSESCDLAEDGTKYRIDLQPLCPNCGSRKMSSWGPVKPVEYIAEDIKGVSHKHWATLTYDEKKLLVENAVTTYLAGRNDAIE